jgi:hypothetical protein
MLSPPWFLKSAAQAESTGYTKVEPAPVTFVPEAVAEWLAVFELHAARRARAGAAKNSLFMGTKTSISAGMRLT